MEKAVIDLTDDDIREVMVPAKPVYNYPFKRLCDRIKNEIFQECINREIILPAPLFHYEKRKKKIMVAQISSEILQKTRTRISGGDGYWTKNDANWDMDTANVYVGPSVRVPGTLGLFAKKAFSKRDKICNYDGKRIRAGAGAGAGAGDDSYQFAIGANDVIDGIHPFSCYGRYINDGITVGSANAECIEVDGNRIIRAKKAIPMFAEILMSYNIEYWLESDRYIVLNEADIDDMCEEIMNDDELVAKLPIDYQDFNRIYESVLSKNGIKVKKQKSKPITDVISVASPLSRGGGGGGTRNHRRQKKWTRK